MNERLQQIFDETPQDDAKSKLDPYRKLIFRWRRQGRTYRRIRDLLAEKCGVQTNVANLYRYTQRRVRPRKPESGLEAEWEESISGPLQPEVHSTARPTTRRSSEEIAAERVRISALRGTHSRNCVCIRRE